MNLSFCLGLNCRIKSQCLRYLLGEKWSYDFSIMQYSHNFVEPAYNGSYCENYIKITE